MTWGYCWPNTGVKTDPSLKKREFGKTARTVRREGRREPSLPLSGYPSYPELTLRTHHLMPVSLINDTAEAKTRVIKMTLPDKPRSSKQHYRLTAHGQRGLETHPGNGVGLGP